MGKPLSWWENHLLTKTEGNKIVKIIDADGLWRQSKVAAKTQLWDRFWDLTQFEKAWVIATFETLEILEQAVDFVANEEKTK